MGILSHTGDANSGHSWLVPNIYIYIYILLDGENQRVLELSSFLYSCQLISESDIFNPRKCDILNPANGPTSHRIED